MQPNLLLSVIYSQLVEEINKFNAEKTEEQHSAIEEYKKTSMKESMAIFESFLRDLAQEQTAKRKEENGEFSFSSFIYLFMYLFQPVIQCL